MAARAVFLDLNGTLVMPIKATSPAEYKLLPDALEAIKLLNSAGFVCPIVTVQSRIAKGLYSEDDFRGWFQVLQSELELAGAEILGPYLCPHRFNSGCACQKPQPALYLQAAQELHIDCTRSYVVGDTNGDLGAAAAIGSIACLVLTGKGSRTQYELAYEVEYVALNLLQAVRWIVSRTLAQDLASPGHLTGIGATATCTAND